MNKNNNDDLKKALKNVLFSNEPISAKKIDSYKDIFNKIAKSSSSAKIMANMDKDISTIADFSLSNLSRVLDSQNALYLKLYSEMSSKNGDYNDSIAVYDFLTSHKDELQSATNVLYNHIDNTVANIFISSYILPRDKSQKVLNHIFTKLTDMFSKYDSEKSGIPYKDFFKQSILGCSKNVPFDSEIFANFYKANLINTDFLFDSEFDFDKKTLESLLASKDNKGEFLFSNSDFIKAFETRNYKLTASNIASRGILLADFELIDDFREIVESQNGFYPAFQTAFQKNPTPEAIPDMFYLLESGYIPLKNLPKIYEAAKEINPELATSSCLDCLDLLTLDKLRRNNNLTPEIKSIYNGLFENKEDRINYEKDCILLFSKLVSPTFTFETTLPLLEENIILPESFEDYVNPETTPILISEFNLPATIVSKFYNGKLITSDDLTKFLSMEEIVKETKSGNLKFDTETASFDLTTLPSNSVFMAYENGLVAKEDISSYISETKITPPPSSSAKLYKDGLIDSATLGNSLSQEKLLEMYTNGDINEEVLGLLSDATRESALSSGTISSKTFFNGYSKDIIDLDTFVSIQPENFKAITYISSDTPSDKIEELFVNDIITYSDLKKLEQNEIISKEQKDSFVSNYDINPTINKFLQTASIKYNNYRPEHSIDPEELLITLGAENIIPVTDDFNFAYIPEHNTGILYETSNYSGYIGTSNKTYTLELLDAIEVVKTNDFKNLPKKYPYISATANFGTELLDSIHTIDSKFEYKSNPDISQYIKDIEVQVSGLDRDED